MSEITVVLTSCNRPNELLRTLKSFFTYNTYKNIKEILIIDDSGIKGCIDHIIKVIPDEYIVKVIYNDKNIGQIKSIDKIYSYINTEFIFHCEDDWEFYSSGFIEKSMDILLKNPKVFTVWLREYCNTNFYVKRNGHTISNSLIDNTYYKLNCFKERDNIWNGFTFNPGLRRLSDYKKVGPYNEIEFKHSGGSEEALSRKYFILGYYCVITTNYNGYVRHIGWDNPVR